MPLSIIDSGNGCKNAPPINAPAEKATSITKILVTIQPTQKN